MARQPDRRVLPLGRPPVIREVYAALVGFVGIVDTVAILWMVR